MPHTHFSANFYLAYVSFLLQGKQHMIRIGKEFDLTLLQTLTMLMMTTTDKISMSDIGSLYACDASNVTGIIDGLETKNLVGRSPHPDDRRIKMIHLTDEGKKLQTKLVKYLAKTSDELFANLTKAEQEQFAKLIQKIIGE